MAKKLALLISNDHYDDKKLGHLLAPEKDVKTLAEVLQQPAYGFQVTTLHNPEKSVAEEQIVDLFLNRHRDDTVLLYFSGHGLLGKGKKLYLALQKSLLDQPSRASLRASNIREDMESCAARRQILLLDCCHSGAFKGSKGSMEALSKESFDVQGKGRAVLAASKATQLAFEDESGRGSLFTRYLVEGLKGEAVNDQGVVTLNRLSDYIHDQVTAERTDMTPVAWIDDKEGQFELGRLQPKAVLPESLLAGLKSESADSRLATVYRLKRYLLGEDQAQAKSARFLLSELKKSEPLHEIYLAIDEVLQTVKPKVTSQTKPATKRPVKPAAKPTSSAEPQPEFSVAKRVWKTVAVAVLGVLGVAFFSGMFAALGDFWGEWSDLVVVSPLESDVIMVNPAKVLNQQAPVSNAPQKSLDLSAFKNVQVGVKKVKKAGEVFQDTLKDGSKAPKMVVIPAGSFRMGCVSGKSCQDNEKPVHRVTIAKNFALGQMEVTFADYDKFAKATKRELPDDEGWGYGKRPVINVDWHDAKAYVKWLSGQTGEQYRLPSESEWEYAARTGTTTPFSTGDCIGTDQANYDGNYPSDGCEKGKYRRKTVAVGSFPANDFGLQDMHGNVWEWTEDCWHGGYSDAPNDGRAWLEGAGAECGRRVVRGGSWYDRAENMRSANRVRNTTDETDFNIGFRIARALF